MHLSSRRGRSFVDKRILAAPDIVIHFAGVVVGGVAQNYNHANVHKAIEDQNLELLRERLFQTVKFSAEGEDPKRPTPLE